MKSFVFWAAVVVFMFAGSVFGVGGDMGTGTDADTDGSAEHPWLLEDFADFQEFTSDPNYWKQDVYTELMCDIDLDPNLPGRKTYTTAVIAPQTVDSFFFEGIKFDGSFDGNRHTISNLVIDTAGARNHFLGLIGNVGSGALVKDLFIEYVSILSQGNSEKIGGLCGENYGNISNCQTIGCIAGDGSLEDVGLLCGVNPGNITKCSVNGDVTGFRDIGGLCGRNPGTIRNCFANAVVTSVGREYENTFGGLCGSNSGITLNSYSTGSVTADHEVGGLCGKSNGSIMNCYSTGAVTGNWVVGGLCGENYYGSITNCYSTGSVSGGEEAISLGGLCGQNYSVISNCFSMGAVTAGANSTYIGGLCGESRGRVINNCFWDIEISGMADGVGDMDPDPAGAVGKTTEQLLQKSIFVDAGWDFVDETANGTSEIWQMPAVGGYPLLSIFNDYIPLVLSGNGSEGSPYLISNATELGAIYNYDYNCCFRLEEDIDLAGIYWSTAVIPYLSGSFDGNGKAVYNLTIQGDNYLGLIGKIIGSEAEIKNIGVADYNISGLGWNKYLGGLCGHNYGKITNSYTTGSLASGIESMYVGGLCGGNDENGSIENCYATGVITGGNNSKYLGGLCGNNHWYSVGIRNCYFAGEVNSENGSEGTGGLCGHSNGKISDCDTSGLVTGWKYVGGLCGKSYGSIRDSYSESDISGSLSVGGLCGVNGKEISFCYASGKVSGNEWGSRNMGGFCGDNCGGEISYCYSSGNVTRDDYGYNLGGFCGIIQHGSIVKNCYSSGNVTAGGRGGNLGGFCGKVSGEYFSPGTVVNIGPGYEIMESVISCSYSSGAVTGGDNSESLGGFCGMNYAGNISNCYCRGNVTSGDNSSNLGGLCGVNEHKVSSCYSTGAVIGGIDSDYVGGLCGFNRTDTTVNSFWDVDSSGMTVGYNPYFMFPGTITNVVGKSTDDLQVMSTFTDAGWDFVGESDNGDLDVWRLCVDGSGYPRLAWEYSRFGDFVCGDGVDLEDFAYFSARDYCSGCGGVLGSAGGVVDLEVLARVAEHWLESWCGKCGGADLTGDRHVGADDLVKVASEWLCSAPVNWDRCDMDGDGVVGDLDFDIWVSYWLEEEIPEIFPVAHWTLDDNFDDVLVSEGESNTYAGIASSNTDTFSDVGVIDGCLNFGGTELVTVADDDAFSFGDGTTDSPFSISAWIYVSGSGTHQIIGKNMSDLNGQWLLRIAYGNLYFICIDDDADSYIFAKSMPLTAGWHHVAATYDGSGVQDGMNIYVDKSLAVYNKRSSGTYTAMDSGGDYPVAIGGRNDVWHLYNDKLDDIKIYNKELSAGEVADIYDAAAK